MNGRHGREAGHGRVFSVNVRLLRLGRTHELDVQRLTLAGRHREKRHRVSGSLEFVPPRFVTCNIKLDDSVGDIGVLYWSTHLLEGGSVRLPVIF